MGVEQQHSAASQFVSRCFLEFSISIRLGISMEARGKTELASMPHLAHHTQFTFHQPN
jgi:hypothetical protein